MTTVPHGLVATSNPTVCLNLIPAKFVVLRFVLKSNRNSQQNYSYDQLMGKIEKSKCDYCDHHATFVQSNKNL